MGGSMRHSGVQHSSTSAGMLTSASLTSGRLHSQLQLTPYLFPLTFIWFSPGALSNCSLWLLDSSSADSYWVPDVWACFSFLPFSLCPSIFSYFSRLSLSPRNDQWINSKPFWEFDQCELKILFVQETLIYFLRSMYNDTISRIWSGMHNFTRKWIMFYRNLHANHNFLTFVKGGFFIKE